MTRARTFFTLSYLFTFNTHAVASDFDVLKPAVEETQQDVAVMTQLAATLGNEGDAGPAQDPRQPSYPDSAEQPQYPAQTGGSDCSFCDESGVQNENNTNQALGILQEVSSSLFNAMHHILLLPQSNGQEYNFNKAFACSYTGDAAIDIGSASLALAYPKNLNPQWQQKENSSVFRLARARDLAFCP